MSDSESNKVVGFTIRLNDGVSANARAVEAAIKKTTQETQAAIKAVQQWNEAQRAQNDALDSAKAAQDEWVAAMKKSGNSSKEAAAAHSKAAEELDKLTKATDRVREAEQAKDAAVARAQTAQNELSALVSKTGTVSNKTAQQVGRLGRAIMELERGNISGAIRALGALGSKLVAVTAIAATAWESFKAGRRAWDWLEGRFMRDGFERLDASLQFTSRRMKTHTREVDEMRAAHEKAAERIRKTAQAQREAAAALSRIERSRLQRGFAETTAGETDSSVVAQKRTELERKLLNNEIVAARTERDGILATVAATEKELNARIADARREQAQAQKNVELAAATLLAAYNNQNQYSEDSQGWKDAQKRVDDAKKQAKDAQAAVKDLSDDIAASQKKLDDLAAERTGALRDYEVALEAGVTKSREIEAAEKTRLAQQKQRIAAIEREGEARERSRQIALQAARDMASLPILGKDATAQDRLDAAREEIEKRARWQLEPLRAEADAAKANREEAERRGNAEEIAAAKQREIDANAELLKQEELLRLDGERRLRELTLREKEAADQRLKAAKDSLDEERRRHRHVMGDITDEMNRQEQARKNAKSHEKFEQKKSAAVQQLQQRAGLGLDVLADNIDFDEDGQIVFKDKAAQKAFDSLSKKQKAAAALGLQERKALKAAEDAVKDAKKDVKAAAAEQNKGEKRNNGLFALAIKLIGSLKALSQIDMGNAESTVHDPTASLTT